MSIVPPGPIVGRSDPWDALRVWVVAAAVFALVYVLWQVREAVLLAFAAAVGAIVLLAAAAPLERRAGLPHGRALLAVGAALVLIVAGLGWLIGAQVSGQIGELSGALSGALDMARDRLGIDLSGGGEGGSNLSGFAQSLFGSLVSLGSTVAGALSSLVVVIAGAAFIAASPGLYRRGLVMLFPPEHHGRIDDALLTAAEALRLWLLSQLISMALVGVLVGLGTWAVGLQAPLALGLFAGLAEFIPLVGSFLGAVPALLLAATQGGSTLLWTAVLFVVVQQVESNIITPLVQRRMVELPPALLLFTVLAVGLLFGPLGVIVAAPLTVTGFVLVKKLYIRDALGEATKVPGEHS